MNRPFSHLLVTGGCGFMGSAFIRHLLLKKSFEGKVLNLDLLTYAGDKTSLWSVENDPRYIFEQGDIRDTRKVEKLCDQHHVDTILHFAAETHVDRSIESPLPFLETNVFGTVSLLEVVRKRKKIHFHHVSTDEVYGSLQKEGFFSEISPYRPNSPYSASKASADHFVRAYHHTYGLSTTISHSTNNYGPHQFPEKLIPVMIRSLVEKKKLPIYGEGKNIRDWLFVEDHAEATLRIASLGKSGGVYDIGGNCEKTNLDLVSLLIKLFSEETKEPLEKNLSLVEFISDRPGHDYRYAINTSKLEKELSWKPHHLLEEGLQKTIRWYLQNPQKLFVPSS